VRGPLRHALAPRLKRRAGAGCRRRQYTCRPDPAPLLTGQRWRPKQTSTRE